MTHYIKHFLFFLCLSTSVFAQVEEVNPPDYIKTIRFESEVPEDQFPILKLGDPLIMEFDALNGDEADYYYKIEHYNFDWTPSILMKNEYIEGLDNQRIRYYENSFNTLQIYSHYTIQIPNQFTRALKVSGNYMIHVYDDYDELVFSRKFMVYEPKANVGVSIKRARNVSLIQETQTVDFKVSSNSIQFINPTQTVKTLVIQNNNLHSAIADLKPTYTISNELIYKVTDNSASFYAGNEFFNFENKDIRAANTGINRIALKDLYHNYLYTNIERYNRPYTYNPDINGNFLPTILDSNPDTEGDYAWIHFSLRSTITLKPNQSIYIYGNFNNYAIDDSTKLEYNAEYNIYEKALLLKQGFYNYKFVVADDNGTIDEGAISGNFYQTENDYKVLVYYRPLASRYDRIVGFGQANSVSISN